MGSRENPDLTTDRSQLLRPATVDPLAGFKDPLAHILLVKILNEVGYSLFQLGFLLSGNIFRNDSLDRSFADGLYEVLPLLLA